MKISSVVGVPLAIPFSYGAGARKKLDFCLVRVETDEGLVGWGEAFSYSCRGAVAAAVNEMIAPLAVGQDAAQISALNLAIPKEASYLRPLRHHRIRAIRPGHCALGCRRQGGRCAAA
ncbi:MAG TPA: hypothetical protein VN929_10290 [Burkholderiales bacterium]|nr:hypothetical protein [Burkholderiales bacterium]